ncbi:MAG: DKNYY domain-containing protein, partial [Bacteroidaceae bacterium]|nr:DKNYY domain-containing protein [Bacteroidaceae bacterium]
FDVYYCGEKVKGAMASSFKYMGGGYGQDSFDVYYRGQKIK